MKKIKLLTLAVPLVLLAIPYHEAKANWIGGFNCFGETDCTNGWNAGISQAQTDWNSGLYSHSLNGGNMTVLLTTQLQSVMASYMDISMNGANSGNNTT
jgi:hypothetical protein